jgi:hypothetical protein
LAALASALWHLAEEPVELSPAPRSVLRAAPRLVR